MELSNPAMTLEVGLACGGSALTFAASHRDNGIAPRGQHFCVDHTEAIAWDDAGVVNLQRANLKEYVTIIREPSLFYALPNLCKAYHGQFGVVYLDGSHLFEDVIAEILYSTRLLRDGGFLLLDDSTSSQVKKAVSFVRNNLSHALEIMPVSTYRTANLATKIASSAHRLQLSVIRKRRELERAWTTPLRRF
jgi:cephalosporin hydroxylase